MKSPGFQGSLGFLPLPKTLAKKPGFLGFSDLTGGAGGGFERSALPDLAAGWLARPGRGADLVADGPDLFGRGANLEDGRSDLAGGSVPLAGGEPGADADPVVRTKSTCFLKRSRRWICTVTRSPSLMIRRE